MADESKKKVLMLDDEPFLLEMYKQSFEKSGFEVATYYDPESALGVLRGGFDPDVILFDITMPGRKSGYEFIDNVQNEKLCSRSLKIALTNESGAAVKARMDELGVDAFLVKAEFIPSEIVTKVDELLGQRSSIQ